MRAVVGEDSYLVRIGLVSVLEEGGIEVAAVAENLDELRAAVAEQQPDVVVTDIRMPPTGTDEGVRFAEELAKTSPGIAVVVLSQHARSVYATAVFAGGNPKRGYLLKDRLASPEYLLNAIRSAVDGPPQLDPQVVSLLVAGDDGDERLDRLTEREQEVLGLVADGMSNAAIAERLVLTTRAVERHINAIFARLGLEDGASTNRRVIAALIYAHSRD